MRRLIISVIAVVALVALVGVATAAEQAASPPLPTGNWHFVAIQHGRIMGTGTVTFNTAAKTLAGSGVDHSGGRPIEVSGTFDMKGRKIKGTFTVSASSPVESTLFRYQGKCNKAMNRMKLSWKETEGSDVGSDGKLLLTRLP